MDYFNSVVIVEGKNDYKRLKQIYPNLDIMITDGSCVMEHIPSICEIAKKRSILVFTDPDFPGEKIRNTIKQYVPEAKHAFLEKSKAISHNHRKVGIEHAKTKDIINALEHTLEPCEAKARFSYCDLFALGLLGQEDSAKKRDILCEKLHIGHCNGKMLVERLNMFGITKEELAQNLA